MCVNMHMTHITGKLGGRSGWWKPVIVTHFMDDGMEANDSPICAEKLTKPKESYTAYD